MRYVFAIICFLHAPNAFAQPNILIVMSDDQGMGDFGCHGHPFLKTPNLDKLHGRSVRFTDFHSAPMCTPTRGQLMTGLDAVRNGATSVTGGRAFLRPGLLTLPELLRRLGYATGLFGKWHLGDNYPHRPLDRGFDVAKYHLGWGMTAAPEFEGKYMDGRYFHNTQEKKFKGYMTDFWFDEAMAWMKECQGKQKPFFCYLPTNAPHGPHVVPEKFAAPYKDKKAANFFGMIANLDENMGRLAEFLQKSGLDENTIVIFMTDNGGTSGVPFFNAGLRAGKTTFYDGGHRVPCWVSWPAGKLGMPRDLETAAQMQDLLPTLAELVGGEIPEKLDGASLAGLLRGTQTDFPDRMLVVQYSRDALRKYESCVIWNHWRLVLGKELYDVKADRAQKNDLALKHPDVAAKLKAHYEKWWKDLEPLSGKFVATAIGSDRQTVTELTSADWQDVYADNAGHVSQAIGGPKGAPWNIEVATDGEYEIAVRRWPRELDLGLRETPNRPDAKALPIAGAQLVIQGKEMKAKPSSLTAKEIVFRLPLKAGRTQLQAWFQDESGANLSGTFYAIIRKK